MAIGVSISNGRGYWNAIQETWWEQGMTHKEYAWIFWVLYSTANSNIGLKMTRRKYLLAFLLAQKEGAKKYLTFPEWASFVVKSLKEP